MDDLRTIEVERWLDDALAPSSDPFLYVDYLPGMKGCDDVRWSRLMRIHLSELVDALPGEWGVSVGRRNVSRSELRSFDFAAAIKELDRHADECVRSDAAIWELLSQDATLSSGLDAIGRLRALGQVT